MFSFKFWGHKITVCGVYNSRAKKTKKQKKPETHQGHMRREWHIRGTCAGKLHQTGQLLASLGREPV